MSVSQAVKSVFVFNTWETLLVLKLLKQLKSCFLLLEIKIIKLEADQTSKGWCATSVILMPLFSVVNRKYLQWHFKCPMFYTLLVIYLKCRHIRSHSRTKKCLSGFLHVFSQVSFWSSSNNSLVSQSEERGLWASLWYLMKTRLASW